SAHRRAGPILEPHQRPQIEQFVHPRSVADNVASAIACALLEYRLAADDLPYQAGEIVDPDDLVTADVGDMPSVQLERPPDHADDVSNIDRVSSRPASAVQRDRTPVPDAVDQAGDKASLLARAVRHEKTEHRRVEEAAVSGKKMLGADLRKRIEVRGW